MPNHAPDSVAASSWRVGTLVYDRAGVIRLFFWLLTGDFLFILINQIEPRVLPVLLKQFDASDQQIAFIIGTIPAMVNLVVNPVVSYRSDRTRTRWGRRIPYLLWATPFASLFLALTPFAPEIARALHLPEIRFLGESWAPTMVAMLAIVFFFQCFQFVIASVYFYLFRDTVPPVFMGRFLSLMRVFSALGVFVLNYWLLGLVEEHSRAIFVAVAALNLVGFGAMCWFVREGEYEPEPAVVPSAHPDSRWRAPWRAAREFVRESFCHPIYWWTYSARLLIYAMGPVTGFTVLFARDELGIGLDTAGKILALPAMAWLLFAYSAGRWIEKHGTMIVLLAGAVFGLVTHAAGYLGAIGLHSFFVITLVTGLAYWLVMLAQIALAQEIFPRARMGQFSSANAMLQSLVIAVVTTPVTGWVLDRLKGKTIHLSLPWGTLEAGAYRSSYLIIAAIYLLTVFCILRARHHWLQLGGRENYVAPLPAADA